MIPYKYNYIGRRIYFLKIDGRVVLNTGEAEGGVNPTTVEQDWEIYSELKKYTKESVDCIELEYGEFRTEFGECTSYKIDVNNKNIIFDYTPIPKPNMPPATPTLMERVEKLEKINEEQDALLLELASI